MNCCGTPYFNIGAPIVRISEAPANRSLASSIETPAVTREAASFSNLKLAPNDVISLTRCRSSLVPSARAASSTT